MQKFARVLIVILICICSLGGIFVGFAFALGSGFAFAGDIDLTDEQREAAQIKVVLGSLFGVALMLGSMLTMLASRSIAENIQKLFGVRFNQE